MELETILLSIWGLCLWLSGDIANIILAVLIILLLAVMSACSTWDLANRKYGHTECLFTSRGSH